MMLGGKPLQKEKQGYKMRAWHTLRIKVLINGSCDNRGGCDKSYDSLLLLCVKINDQSGGCC